MTCPICAFPGNGAAAVRCSNCGFAMRPAPPNPVPDQPYSEPPVLAVHDVYPTFGAAGHPYEQSWPQPVSAPPMQPPTQSPTRSPLQPAMQSSTRTPPRSSTGAPPVVPRPRRSRVVVPLTVIVVGLVVAGAVVAVVRMTGGSRLTPAAVGTTVGWGAPSDPQSRTAAAPGSPADPRAQAAAVDAVLDASVASRRKLNDAIALVEDCTTIEQAIADLRTAGTERQSQLDSVAAVDLSAVPEGEQVRSLLTAALGYSLAADRSFVLWGQAVQASGCDGGGREHYQEAQRQSRLAGDAKAGFLTVWNPVAARHGLRDRATTEI